MSVATIPRYDLEGSVVDAIPERGCPETSQWLHTETQVGHDFLERGNRVIASRFTTRDKHSGTLVILFLLETGYLASIGLPDAVWHDVSVHPNTTWNRLTK